MPVSETEKTIQYNMGIHAVLKYNPWCIKDIIIVVLAAAAEN